jgi:hypothetical protein
MPRLGAFRLFVLFVRLRVQLVKRGFHPLAAVGQMMM